MIRTLLREIKQYKLISVVTSLGMLAEVIVENFIPYKMATIINSIEKHDLKSIYHTALIMLLLAVAGLISGGIGAVFGAKASTGFARNLRKAMYEKIQKYSFSNIDKFSTSGLVTRLTTDVTNVQNAYQMILRMCVRAPFSMIVAIIMSFVISPKIALIYVAAVVFLSIIIVFLSLNAHKYFKQVFERYDDLNESVQENVEGIRVVKAFVREDFEKGKFGRASYNIYRMFVKAETIISFNFPAMMAAMYGCTIAISWVGARLIVNKTNVANPLTTGELSSLLAFSVIILMNLMMLSFVFVMVTMSAASAKRIAEVIEENPDITNPEEPVMEVKDGSIDFENVVFRYNANSEEPILDDINLHIDSGSTIGIMGGTGSAKSTLVNLISRLYDVESGEVKVGGLNVKEYDLEHLREKVSVVLQKNVLFTGTIMENLRWGNENATDEECINAAKLACAHEFVMEREDGYNTMIEQGGSNVSGGQRQRLCIARALLKNPKVLILDDSTSAVDTLTDRNIRKSFKERIPDTTKIIIAQRISSIQEADKIVVMNDGKIDGVGTHEELLANNSIYQEIYNQQTNDNADFDKKGGEE